MTDAAKDEICWRLMKEVRRTARKRGVSALTDEQKFSVFKRHFRAIRHSVEGAA